MEKFKLNNQEKVELKVFKQTPMFKAVKEATRQHPSAFMGWSENYLILFAKYCINSNIKCSQGMRKDFEQRVNLVVKERKK